MTDQETVRTAAQLTLNQHETLMFLDEQEIDELRRLAGEI